MIKAGHFKQGDVVELRARGFVTGADQESVHIKLDDVEPRIVLAVPRQMLINLSDAREISEEEARGLLEDEL